LNIFRIIIKALVVAFVVALLVYSGWFHLFTLFLWQHPMLGWLPLLALLIVGFAVGVSRAALSARSAREAPPAELSSLESEAAEADVGAAETSPSAVTSRSVFAWGWGLLAFAAVLITGLVTTLFATPHVPLSDIDYELVDALPQSSQPRLLPRTSVNDDPNFNDTKEIHLVRNPQTGELLWTGEWQSAWLGGASSGISVKNLDEVKGSSDILRGGFEHSVGGIAPGTLKWQSKWNHPVSRIQYPVVVPATTGDDTAFAMAPYVGFRGFPYKTPYFKGVLVYHQDGTLEDLTPEEAADRPELVATGRIYPEALARSEAEAIADEFGGEIKDAEGNKQPFLTSIDDNTTNWVTVINGEGANSGVIAVVLQDSSTGDMKVWQPKEGEALVSTRYVIDSARALPLQWEETRCCDSEGDSYEVQLREVVEPRLAFKDGKPYYLVTVAPTDDLALSREIEYTLLIDAETGETIKKFDHVSDPSADTELAEFFR
jgi:hypothetical protein